jgi:hypothetical protein
MLLLTSASISRALLTVASSMSDGKIMRKDNCALHQHSAQRIVE